MRIVARPSETCPRIGSRVKSNTLAAEAWREARQPPSDALILSPGAPVDSDGGDR